MEAHALEHVHHGPPEANRSSRVDARMLGMLLFIISEVMVFGAFFTAYFFIRVVNNQEWPAEGTELPKVIAGVNTAILLASSLTLHWAQSGIKHGNRFALKAGMLTTFLLGATFLFVQINEYVHIGFSPQDSSEPFRAEVEKQPPLDAMDPAKRFQGGAFVRMGPFETL